MSSPGQEHLEAPASKSPPLPETEESASSQKPLPRCEDQSFVDQANQWRQRRRWVSVPLPVVTPEDERLMDEADRQEDALLRERGISSLPR